MANKELSFGYVKSEGIDGPCEAEVRKYKRISVK